MKVPTEHAEQVALVQWFRAEHPNVLMFAIPNGGWRSKATAAKLKLEGVVPGVPDLCIPEWRLYIEMKRTKGWSVSDDQKAVMAELERVGYTCVVCRGFLEAKMFLQNFTKYSLPQNGG